MSVGLVIPTLGERLELLDLALSSIQGQTGVESAVVIVSPAHRVEFLRARYPDAEVIAEPGGGIAFAIEAAWAALGSVDYLAWLGDDDLIAPDSFRAASVALDRRPKASFVYGRCQYIDLQGSLICEVRPGRVAVPLLRLGRNTIAQPGALYRRTVVEAIGGLDTDLRLAFDVDLHLRLAAHGGAVYLPKVLGAARAHPTSLTTAQRAESFAETERVTSRARGPWSTRTRGAWDAPAELAKRVVYKASTQRP